MFSKEFMDYILKRIERNFREYAGSYLGIDSIKYEKGSLIISRKDFNDPFTDVEKSMISRFLSIYKKEVSYEVKGNKIEIFI